MSGCQFALGAAAKISLHITGVICADTLPESRAVLETGLSRGKEMIERKRSGEKIHTNEAILR